MKSLRAEGELKKVIAGLHLVPGNFHKPLLSYIKTGAGLDGFILAVIECQAWLLRNTHPEHLRKLEPWAKFLKEHAPANCWGSREKRRAWQELGGLEGWES